MPWLWIAVEYIQKCLVMMVGECSYIVKTVISVIHSKTRRVCTVWEKGK